MEDQNQMNAGNEPAHPEVLVNDNPLSGLLYPVVGFIQTYGWLIVFGVIVLMYVKSKLSPTLQKYKKQLEETIENKKFDPEKVQSRLEAMEASRRRLQEELDAQAAKHLEQMKQKEEEKRKQKIEDWEGHLQGKGYRSKTKPKEETVEVSKHLKPKPTSLRPADYNPLAGNSGSCAWRPSQRSGGGGGGG